MCRNHKHSYTPITDKQRAKSRMNCHSNNRYNEKKIPRNTTNKGCKGPLQGELQTAAQGNKRGHKQMEKHSMLMVGKNQYCENGHTAQSNLEIQCYPNQAFQQIWKKPLQTSYGTKRELAQSRQFQAKRTKLEASLYLTSNYITRLQ